jgi:hypothetical protein
MVVKLGLSPYGKYIDHSVHEKKLLRKIVVPIGIRTRM